MSNEIDQETEPGSRRPLGDDRADVPELVGVDDAPDGLAWPSATSSDSNSEEPARTAH